MQNTGSASPFALFDQESERWLDANGSMTLFDEQSTRFCGTWPTSGSMRNGAVSKRQPLAPRMAGSGYSSSRGPESGQLLRTPVADEDGGGPLHPDVARERGQTLRLTGQILAMTGDLLPTPVAQPSGNSPQDHLRKKPGRTRVTDLAILAENDLIRTGGRVEASTDTNDE